jgi:hypothetical protein
MRQQLVSRSTCLVVCSLIFVSGCGSGGKPPPKLGELVPVTGTVTMDGQPLAKATVVFHPTEDSGFHGSQAVTDENGKYKLETDIGDGKMKEGALPGRYQVTVSRLVKPATGEVVTIDPKASVGPMTMGAVQSIPMRFSALAQTVLEADVKAGGAPIDFAIKKE